MKYKKTIIISLALVAFYFTMLVISSTSLGYMIALLWQSSYSSHSKYERSKLENEGDAPGEFQIALHGDYKTIYIIPCLFHYMSNRPKRIDIAYRISDDLADYRYLDLTRLEVVLENGGWESLLPPERPFRIHFGNHKDAHDCYLYEAGELKNVFGRRGAPQTAEFRLSGRPPSKQMTLIAEGTLYQGMGEGRPFRQVAVWQLIADREWIVFNREWVPSHLWRGR